MSKTTRPFALAAIVALLAAGVPGMVRADNAPAVYTGTLGRQSIVLELDSGDGSPTAGRYFYTRHHRDLPLTGTPADTSAHRQLREGWNDDPTHPRVTLDRQADGGWRGNWTGPNGKTLPIALRPARPAPPADDTAPWLKKLYASDPYEYLRLAGLRPQAGKHDSFMGHGLQWWRIPDAGIAFFQVEDGYPQAERVGINLVLMDRLWQETSAFYGCLFNHFDEGSYDQTVTPYLLSPTLVSIGVFTNQFCGGAHPDFGDAPINLDARTAQPLALEDLLWVGEGKPLHYATNEDGNPAPGSDSFDAYAEYRGKVLAPWLVQQWQRLYPGELATAQRDDDCDFSDPGVWEFASWHLTPKGIVFGPSFARVARACEAGVDWSVLPWNVVRGHPGRLRLTP